MSFFQLPLIQYSNTFINSINPNYLDTSGADTSGADTSGADTSGADTSGADTSGADKSSYDHFIINKSLCKYLSFVKEQIDTRQNDWDKFKKFTNTYEYIHSIIPNTKSSVCVYKPLSRSFYKMIEICKTLNILEDLPNICKSFHLAEGPGGFIEALSLMRLQKRDTYYGMTLIDDENGNVPGWRKSRSFLLNNPNVVIEKGYDERGDLMSPDNLKYCYMKYNGSIDLITADGGFDFSHDFNRQEIVGSKLILCQIAFATAIQKPRGNFIIKFFDTFTKLSLDLLFLLSNLYEQVYFIKPNTSRQANSEKYVVCKGFRLYSSEELVKKFHKILTQLLSDDKQITSLFNFDLPYIFINKVEEINAIFGQQQIENIVNTLNLIDNTNNNKFDKLENMKKSNIQKCITWCQKYNVPYNQFIHSTNIFLSSRNTIIERALPIQTF
jgi:23S rRNA U2552 (ribose-2'-O)-methylase RlmE/FtsJ